MMGAQRLMTDMKGGRILEKLAYLVSLIGFGADQLSTRLGLTSSLIFEKNHMTGRLMEMGMWLPVDLLAVLVIVSISQIIIRRWDFKYRWAIILLPFTYGVLKLITGISNFYLCNMLL
jgi:uncharacterized membrane protein YqjE